MRNFFTDFGFDASQTDFENFETHTPVAKKKSGWGPTHRPTGPLHKFETNDKRFQEVKLGKKKEPELLEWFWTFMVYVFLTSGLFLRRVVDFPHIESGIKTQYFQWGIVAAAFIIGLAMLAPLLRILSKYRKGRLSFSHCLTSFTIGFFSELTFTLMLNGFIKVMG